MCTLSEMAIRLWHNSDRSAKPLKTVAKGERKSSRKKKQTVYFPVRRQQSSRNAYRVLRGRTDSILALAELPNRILASGTRTGYRQERTAAIKLWDIDTGECTQTLTGHTRNVMCLAALPGGILASGSADNTSRLWQDGECIRTLTGHTKAVNCLAALPNGMLASGSSDTTIKIWQPRSGACVRTLTYHSKSIKALVAMPDGTLSSSSTDGTIEIRW